MSEERASNSRSEAGGAPSSRPEAGGAPSSPPEADRTPSWLPGKIGRRRILGFAAVSAGAAALGLRPWQPPYELSRVPTPGPSSLPPIEDRVLVVVELRGGNDALNTLAPIDEDYRRARPRIGLTEADALQFPDLTLGVHPALSSLESGWRAGQIAAVLGVGPAAFNRSHFVARDYLHLGAHRSTGPGLIGRNAPSGLGDEDRHGQGEAGEVWGLALGEPSRLLAGPGTTPVVNGANELVALATSYRAVRPLVPMLAALSATAHDQGLVTSDASSSVLALGDLIEPVVEWARRDGATGTLDLFDIAAFAIEHWRSLRVIHLTVNGFDTHAAQSDRHAPLLATLASGLDRLFSRLDEVGRADATLAVTISEFGRSVRENGSGGTDHGTAGMSFVMGPAVNGRTVAGSYRRRLLDRGGMRKSIDGRAPLNVGLRWIGAPEIESFSPDRLDLLRVDPQP